MRNLITAQEVIDLAFAENSNMMAESISDTAIRIAEIKYIRPAFGVMYPLLADKYADFTNDYVKPALAYFVKCEIVSSIAIDMSNSGVAVANPQYQSAATDKQRQRLYDSEMSKAKTLLDFALEYIATHSESFPDFSGEAPKKHHRVGGILLGGGTSRNQFASITGEAFKNEIERLSKDVAGKVDKVKGKGLSTNDYTDADKALVQTIPDKVDYDTFNNSQEYLERKIESLGEHISEVGDLVDTKANKGGYYPDMSVGMADNLVGRGDVQDAQINFRPSAGEANITDHAARIERIKGNSVVWNQLVKTIILERVGGVKFTRNGITFEKISNELYHISGDCTDQRAYSNDAKNVDFLANHYYLFDISGCEKSYISVYLHNSGLNLVGGTNSQILQCKIDGTGVVSANVGANTTGVDEYVSFKIIDLTQMFGAGNEPTTVEEYRQRKPMNIEDEFAYNAGTLVDMKVDSLISTSDNAYDYDYEKGYARVMGGQTYDCSYGSAFVEKVYFSTDKDNIVAEENAMTSENGKYTFPSDGYAVPYTTDGDVREYCVCLQHTYTKPHPAYQQEVKDLSFIGKAFPEGMRSISMKNDANNTNINADIYDEICFNATTNKWEAIKRIGVVDLGSLDISYDEGTGCFLTIGNSRFFKPYSPILSSVYTFIRNGNPTTLPDMHISSSPYFNNGVLFMKNSAYTDVASFKQAMQEQGVTLYYELAEPIVEEIDLSPNFNLDYFAWDFGTEEAIASVPSAPFRADINYEPNAVDDLRWAVAEIRNLKAQIAQMQTSVTNLTE